MVTRSNHFVCAFLFCLLFVMSCSKKDDEKGANSNPPETLTANFVALQYHAEKDDFLFEFSNTSKNAIRYEWNFGDGTQSNQFEPNHIYEKHGAYEVSLFAFDENNNVSKKTITVTYGIHKISTFSIDSAESILTNYVDTFANHDLHVQHNFSGNIIAASFDELFPLEFNNNSYPFDFERMDPLFEIQIRHNQKDGLWQCSNFEELSALMATIRSSEKLKHSVELLLVKKPPCEGAVLRKLFCRFEIVLMN